MLTAIMNTSERKYGKKEDCDGSSETLLDHRSGLKLHSETNHHHLRWSRVFAMHLAAILIYGLVAVMITYKINTSKSCDRPQIYSPANHVIRYERKLYNGDLKGDPEYFGTPSTKVDINWHKLMEPSSIHLEEAERQHFDRDKPIVQFPDGTYMGQLFVYHELHCLKRLYQFMHQDYYFPNLTDKQREMNAVHTEHCFGTLRQAIMCHGDVSVMTMVWGKQSRVPLGDFSNQHQCVDFERLHEWALSRAVVDGLKPGVLVHPTLGPSFPDGHGTKIGFSDKDIDRDGNPITIYSNAENL